MAGRRHLFSQKASSYMFDYVLNTAKLNGPTT